MSRERLAAAGVVGALAVAACLPASVRPSDPASPTAVAPTPRGDLCGQLGRVYDERNALADAFRLVVDNKVDEGVRAASSIRGRLDALIAALPDDRGLAESTTRLRGSVEAAARIVQVAAETVDDPRRPVPDRQLILVEGEPLIGVIDKLLSVREPGDTVSRACPGLAYAPVAIPFPPRPSVADLGLPDRAGRLVLDAASLATLGGSDAEIVTRLGGDPGRARMIEVDVVVGEGGYLWLRVLEGTRVDPAAFAAAVAIDFIGADTKRVGRRIAGFEVHSFVDRADPSDALQVAWRGDRILMMSFEERDVDSLLAAMP